MRKRLVESWSKMGKRLVESWREDDSVLAQIKALLQEYLKKSLTTSIAMPEEGFANRFNGGPSMTPPLKTKTIAVISSNVTSSKQTTTKSTTRRSLNLTPKQLEERKLQNPKRVHVIFHVFQLKKTHDSHWHFSSLLMFNDMFTILEPMSIWDRRKV